MIVGLTFDLKDTYLKQGFSKKEVAEFDSEETIFGIENTLNILGHQTERIGNIIDLTHALVKGDRWDLVFNIAEGLFGMGREAQVPALLDAYRVPYVFSDPVVLSVTLHKAMSKHIVKGHGIPTAPFQLVRNPNEFNKVTLEYPLFIKPLAEGTGKGITAKSVVNSLDELTVNGIGLFKEFRQPVLVEEYLPGREFTVGITGTGKNADVCGVMEVSVKDGIHEQVYSLENKENYKGRVDYSLPEESLRASCGKLAIDAWNALECRDGGRVDIKLDKHGIPCFIEVNPLAGLNPIHSDLPILCRLNGISYVELIRRIMNSAIERMNP
jgi:D-alanine-D-alanine ligase